jgi:hypothetical protein
VSPSSSSERRRSFTFAVLGTSITISIVKTGVPMNGADSRVVSSSSMLMFRSRRNVVILCTIPG